ncbi:flagellin [Luteibacter jiangsuensis]|uniref:Flagellin n=1 Tax=Luteibacter jiangsuensis TaxID=637577 RepID=A0ABX0Q1X4_9GAMM|nr:flagellin [Luteibacter jiangsuensis]NID03965.1 flagellin [Luteibacter jiangsuensis]
MALTINTNIMSLNAQRNLSTSQTKLSSAIERLSSGNRINSAKDDAAGLAISTRFTTQINGLTQAVRNANDGISLSQTTESALDEVTNNLQRIRELAVQSTNASNSASDRAALDAEVQQRLSEVTRIATQTNFNGMKVLDGSAKELSFQVGANVGEVITVGLDKGVKANQIGQLATDSVDLTGKLGTTTTEAVATDWTAANASAKGVVTYGSKSVDWGTYTGATQADAVNFLKAQLGSDFTVANNTTTATSIDVTDNSVGKTLGAGDLTISVGGGTSFDITGNFKTAQDVADAVNSHSSEGITAYVGTDGKLNIASAKTIAVSGAEATNLGFAATDAVNVTDTLATSSIKTVDGANDTINRVDAALQSISDLRSDLGAVQNRFESTISNLQNISQNLTASRSAITDADFAQETANMSSAQILQQAGVSVLAQANQSQQIVQKLLQ